MASASRISTFIHQITFSLYPSDALLSLLFARVCDRPSALRIQKYCRTARRTSGVLPSSFFRGRLLLSVSYGTAHALHASAPQVRHYPPRKRSDSSQSPSGCLAVQTSAAAHSQERLAASIGSSVDIIFWAFPFLFPLPQPCLNFGLFGGAPLLLTLLVLVVKAEIPDPVDNGAHASQEMGY